MTRNKATIYSNGIADFQRWYSVKKRKSTQILIPVRQEHLGDVLASLTVSGKVKIESPPVYQPANSNETSLNVAPGDGYESMVAQLSGCRATVTTIGERTVSGELVGMDTQQIATTGEPVPTKFLVLHDDGVLERLPFDEITQLKFDDAFVQSEIQKALSQQLRKIKPNSSFVELTVSAEDSSTDALVQYSVPAAAWKFTYRLILSEEGPIEMHGHAVVDNNTEEDWVDFKIAVVMGQPITFSTDLAESKTPARRHIDIVQETALGAVEPEPGAVVMGAPASLADEMEMPRSFSKRSSRHVGGSVPKRIRESASFDEPEVQEAGDFCIFESSIPVSIHSNRSAVIPLFQTSLGESDEVLHYNKQHHAERPFRTIRFKNTTPYPLSRGVCTVFDVHNYAGSCIVPNCAPGEEALLPHALETGVRVHCIQKKVQRRRTAVKISEGTAYQSFHLLQQTDYQVSSRRDVDFPFVLDHQLCLHQSNIQVQLIRTSADEVHPPESLEFELLKSGLRIERVLQQGESYLIRVVETKVEKSKIVLAGEDSDDLQFGWLAQNVQESDTDIINEATVRRCIELQRKLDDAADQIAHAEKELDRLNRREERLRENIRAGVRKARVEKWEAELVRAEDAIVQLEEERVPELLQGQRQIREQLYDAIRGLTLEWIE